MEEKEALIVPMEDDPEKRQDLHRLLELQGYHISLIADAAHALRLAEERKPGILLLISRRVTQVELGLVGQFYSASPTTRILLLCRKGDWSEYLKLLDHGGDDLLVPPLHSSDLKHALKRRIHPPGISPRVRPACFSRQD